MGNSITNINQDRPIYFSYARNSNKKPEWEHISDCVNTLLYKLTANCLEYRLDVEDIGMGDMISKFEEEIGWNSEVVVIVFSDKYFRSMHCMYEFVQIKNALKFYPNKRLMCIKSGNFNLADTNYIRDLEHYWNNQKIEYEDIEFHRLREHSGTEKAAYENGFYLEDIRKMYSFFSAINYSNANNINYDSLIYDIIKYYTTTPKPALTPKPKSLIQPLSKTANTQSVQKNTQNVQLTASTPQQETKKFPTIPIAIVAAIVVALIVSLWVRNTIKSTTETVTADNSVNNDYNTNIITLPEQSADTENGSQNGNGIADGYETDNETGNETGYETETGNETGYETETGNETGYETETGNETDNGNHNEEEDEYDNESEDEVFFIVEDMPEFPGGEIALRRYITENLRYPEKAKKNNIQGSVYVRFVVDKKGRVTNVELLRGVDPSLDEEALRVVKSLPDWKPGKNHGKLVRVSHSIPIKFVLN